MGGFRLPKRTALIEFEEGHEYHGLRVRVVLDAPVEFMLAMQTAVSGGLEQAGEALRAFGDDCLLEWNLEGDDGQPVPANGNGMLRLPPVATGQLITRWMEAATQPAAPLGGQSPNGGTSEPGQSGPTAQS